MKNGLKFRRLRRLLLTKHNHRTSKHQSSGRLNTSNSINMTIPTDITVVHDMDISDIFDEDYCRWERITQCCSLASSGRPSYPKRRVSIVQHAQQPAMRRCQSYDSDSSKKSPSFPRRRASVILDLGESQHTSKSDSTPPTKPMRRTSVLRSASKNRAALAA